MDQELAKPDLSSDSETRQTTDRRPARGLSNQVVSGLLILVILCTTIFIVHRINQSKQERAAAGPETLRSEERQKADRYFLRRHYKLAIPEYEKLVEADPYNGVALFRLGYCHHQLKQYDQALEIFEKSAEFAQQRNNSHFLMAVIYGYRGDNKKSMEHLTLAIENGFVTRKTIWQYSAFSGFNRTGKFRRLANIEARNRQGR